MPGVSISEYMDIEEPDLTEPLDFYYPCASDTPAERRAHAASRRLYEEGADDE